MTTKEGVTPRTAPVAVGQVREIPIPMARDTLWVECLIADSRKVFGRTEYQIAPVSGSGLTWVQENGILSQIGPGYVPPDVVVEDQEKGL